MKRIVLAAAAALFLVAGPVLASPPVVTSSIAIDQSPVALGDFVTFTTTYPKGTHNPWISVYCYQSGVLVYGEGGPEDGTFVLGGATSDWAATGGSADCRAELGDLYFQGGQQHYVFLADTTFAAGG